MVVERARTLAVDLALAVVHNRAQPPGILFHQDHCHLNNHLGPQTGPESAALVTGSSDYQSPFFL